MPAGKASIDWDGYELLLRFEPFRPDIVDELKASIPQHSRRWYGDEKVWRVSTIYKAEIEEVFDVFDYAVRDYTGDDPAAKTRQAGLRAEREARINDAERIREEKARAKDERAKEEEDRKRKADEARQRTGRGYSDPNSYRSRIEGHFVDDEEDEYSDRYRRIQAEMRAKFFAVWPECAERDFLMWWSWYTIYGKDEANRKFNILRGTGQRRQQSSRRFNENFWQNFSGNAPKPIDHYAVLGIVRTCTATTAKAAYRALAMKWHPDRNPNDAKALEMMKTINAAYDAIKQERQWT